MKIDQAFSLNSLALYSRKYSFRNQNKQPVWVVCFDYPFPHKFLFNMPASHTVMFACLSSSAVLISRNE